MYRPNRVWLCYVLGLLSVTTLVAACAKTTPSEQEDSTSNTSAIELAAPAKQAASGDAKQGPLAANVPVIRVKTNKGPFPVSEAVVPGTVSDSDLRALPSNKHHHPDGARLIKVAADAKSAAPRRAAEAASPKPVASSLVERQQAYLREWQSRRAEFDAATPAARERKLSELKRAHLGGGR